MPDSDYLKAIVALAGLKVSPVNDGLPVEIAARWNGQAWDTPVLSAVTNTFGTLSWTQLTNRLFKRTLEPLADTFKAVQVPAGVWSMGVLIHPHTKKPHYVVLKRWDVPRIPDVPEYVNLSGQFAAEPLMTGLKHLLLIRKRLRGQGYE